MRFTRTLLAVICALASFAALPARAEYPDRPIKLIVPFPAGGGGDVLARVMGHAMSENLGQQIVIENKPGAGGALGLGDGAKAAPDGYTLVWTSISLPVVAATLPNLSFDPDTAYAHIAKIAANPFVLVINPQVPAKNVKELVALAKKEPGKLNFAHNGSGTLTKLVLMLFATDTGIKITDVGYRGDNFSSLDVIAGHVQGMFSNSPVALPHVKSGELHALAVTSPQRSSAAPDLPTMIEAGVPDFQAMAWHGLSAPKGTPKPIIDRLNAAVNASLNDATVKQTLAKLGTDSLGPSTPEEYTKLVNSEIAYWKSVAARTK